MFHIITLSTHLPGLLLPADSAWSWAPRRGLDDLYSDCADIFMYASGRVMEAITC